MGEAATLLGTNPKTFKNWLKQDGIDIENQLNRADSREKYVTDEQIIAIAKKRDIEVRLPDPERKSESTSARILAGVDERFAKLEQQLAGRIDQLTAEVPTMLADLRRHLEQQLTHHFDQLDAHLEQRLTELQQAHTSAPPQEHPPTPAPRARIAATTPSPTTTPPKPTAKKRVKRKTRGKKLPGTLIPLHFFAHDHGISEKAADHAVQTGKMTVERGRWLYNSRYVFTAVNQQGQHEFYELFHERQGFTICKRCPHAS